MTEELQGALTEILNGVLTAKDFMLAELPEVIQQLLLWNFWYNLIVGLSFIPVTIMGVKVFKVIRKWYNEAEYSDKEIPLILGAASTVAYAIIILSTFNFTWLKIWLAPKVYLIEYAASLAK